MRQHATLWACSPCLGPRVTVSIVTVTALQTARVNFTLMGTMGPLKPQGLGLRPPPSTTCEHMTFPGFARAVLPATAATRWRQALICYLFCFPLDGSIRWIYNTLTLYIVRGMDGLVVCAMGWRSSSSGVRAPVRPSVQGPVGEVPATAPFSIPLHHRYRRWMGGVSRPRSFCQLSL